jgi:hypothetical protein
MQTPTEGCRIGFFAKFIRKQMYKFNMMLAYMKTYPDEWWYHEKDIA